MNRYSWIHQIRQISETLGEFQPLWPLYYRITHHSCISSLFLATRLPCYDISCFSARSGSSRTLPLSLPASQTSNLELRRGRTSCLMRYKYLNRQEFGAQTRLLRQVDDAILAPSNAMISAHLSLVLQEDMGCTLGVYFFHTKLDQIGPCFARKFLARITRIR
jgi:hypothetical protein